MSSVLLVGFEGEALKTIEQFYRSVGVPCENVDSLETAFERIAAESPTLVLAQRGAPHENFTPLNMALKKNAPTTPFVVVLEDNGMPSALEALREGAYDCLTKPLRRFDILAASKRATSSMGRTLFVKKIIRPRRRTLELLGTVFLLGVIFMAGYKQLHGPPSVTFEMDSKFLSGIQWADRIFWIGDWFNGTVTKFRLNLGIYGKARKLTTDGLFRMKEGQPILVCHTGESLITIGTDLYLRSHKWDVGLPTLQTVKFPSNNPTGLAWDGEYIWASDGQSSRLYRFDTFLRVLDSEPCLPSQPKALAYGDKSFWVAGGRPINLYRFQKRGQGMVWKGPYSLAAWVGEGDNVSGMAFGFGRLWFLLEGEPRVRSVAMDVVLKKKVPWKKGPSVAAAKGADRAA